MADETQQSQYQDALNTSLGALNAEEDAWNTLNAQLQQAQTQPRPTNPDQAKGYDDSLATLAGRLEASAGRVATAHRTYATLLERVAHDSEQHVQKASDPNQQKLWADQAANAHALAELHQGQADSYAAKTESQRQLAEARVNAAAERARAAAGRVDSQNSRDQSQAALDNAKAAQLPVLTPVLVAQHQAQADRARKQGALAEAQATKTAAQTEVINLSAELARETNPLKKQELQAKIDAAKQKLNAGAAWQDVTGAHTPFITQRNPLTGDLRAQPDPGYQNVQQQAIKDYYDAIESLKQQMAQPGSPITPAIGDAMMQGIKASAEAKLLGTDVLSYQKQQEDLQHQKQLDAVNLITSRLKAGNDLAGTFWDAASKAAEHGAKLPDLSGIDRLSQAYATEAYGGQGAMDQARAILQGLGPVQSPTDILTHLGAITHAENILKGGQGSTQQPPPAPQAPQPAPQNAPLPSGVSPMGMTGGGQSALPGDRYGAGGLVQPPPTDQPPTDQPPTDENDPLAALLSGAGVG